MINTQRKHFMISAGIVGALILLAGMSLATISAPVQNPAFQNKDQKIASGPKVYSPGTQRDDMIRVLQSIDSHLVAQNRQLERIHALLKEAASE